MANKMSMVKIAVLGEGGVGKTSLTIQVSPRSHELPPKRRPPLLIDLDVAPTFR